MEYEFQQEKFECINNNFLNALTHILTIVLCFFGFGVFGFAVPLLVKAFVPSKYHNINFQKNIDESLNYNLTMLIFLICSILFFFLGILIVAFLIKINEWLSLAFIILSVLFYLIISIYYFVILVIATVKALNNEGWFKMPLVIPFIKR